MNPAPPPRSNRMIAFSAVGAAIAMLCMSYAAVPLYDMFCRVTGYGGRTQVAVVAPQGPGQRHFQVRFDANVASGLDWKFESETPAMTLRTGETKTVFFKVTNRGTSATTGIASYNVAPDQMGSYFNKINCFCFTEQTLQPGETMDMPVVFFIDPALETEPDMAQIRAVTLSYTFHLSKQTSQPKVGAVAPEGAARAL